MSATSTETINGITAGTTNFGTLTETACSAAAPTATTYAASGVATDNGTDYYATLNGVVSSNGAATFVSFEYGMTTGYGTTITATPNPLAASAVNSSVSAMIYLACNTTIHYRVVATNSAGPATGILDSTFTSSSCTAPLFGPNDCAATRFGKDLGCSANDVNLTNIALAPGSISSCVSGTPVTLDLDLTVNFASPDRWDVGIFIANDGKLPTLLPASGGASSCSVDILPITPQPSPYYQFPDLDGVPMGTADTCGDGNLSINGGTGSGIKHMAGVTLPCYASPASGGKLFVPFAVSWDNQKSPIGGLCTSKNYPVPNTTSKCNAPLSTVSIEVVVLPKINKTHSGATFNSGDSITYSIVVFNDSGGTLQQSKLTDPVVGGLTVGDLPSDVTCTAANGSTCPTTTKALIQGTGIVINPTDLPNNSSLIFTVKGILTGIVGAVISNKATITMPGGSFKDSIDSVTLGAASGAKSFAPTSITEGSNSLMTITFTNPTASPVTGVAFTDTYPSGLVNTASASGATTCSGGTVTAANNGGSVALSGGTVPANGTCTVTVNVTSATANSYVNSVTFSSGIVGSTSATLSVTAAVIGAFNAGEVGTWVRASPDVAVPPPHIYTKLVGSAFSLELAALKADTNKSRNTSYSGTVSVQLFDATGDSSTCPINSTLIGIPISVSFAPSNTNKGVVTVGPFQVSNAYGNVRVYVTETTGGNPKSSCSSDNFAIRPTAFTITSSTAIQTNSSGSPFIKTGANFNLAAASVPGYNGTPNIDNTKVVGTPTPGTIGGSFSAAPVVTGTATGTTFTYSEVGNFGLNADAVVDSSFTGVDGSSDCVPGSTSYSLDINGKYGCIIGSNPVSQTTGTSGFGRFVPDHFGITGTVQTRSDLLPVTGSTFTYMDEPMKLSLVVTAYNKNEGVTQNYAGSLLAKLDATTLSTGINWFNTGCPAGTQCMGLGAENAGSTGLSGRLGIVGALTYASVGDPSSSWSAGVGTFTANVKLARNATPDGPYETLAFGAMPQDSDGVTLPGVASADSSHRVDLNATTGNTLASNPDPANINERRQLFTTKARFGRLKLSNAFGSEKSILNIPVQAQYWSGSSWVLNSDDSITPIPATSVKPSNYRDITGLPPAWTTTPTGPGTLVGGYGGSSSIKTDSSGASVAAPGAGISLAPPLPLVSGRHPTGSVDICVDLGADLVGGVVCSATSANLPYLKGKWPPGANYDNDPSATATFGVYSPEIKKTVHVRELY